jgi:hypothetical protein
MRLVSHVCHVILGYGLMQGLAAALIARLTNIQLSQPTITVLMLPVSAADQSVLSPQINPHCRNVYGVYLKHSNRAAIAKRMKLKYKARHAPHSSSSTL